MLLALLSACFTQPPADAATAAPFVVHEWGTFTAMQGSDGVGLEGLQHEEEELPRFVYSRTEVRECPLREYGYKGLEVPVTDVTQKMETPVIYFHTDEPLDARVRVDFVDGLLTQWYPVTDTLGPPELTEADGPLSLETVDRSFLEWDIELIPQHHSAPSEIPLVAPNDPWDLARRVDAAYVRTIPRDQRAGRHGPTEAEHYLFYRGLGTHQLPLHVQAYGQGRAQLTNGGDFALPAVFALEVRGEQGRWMPLPAMAGGDSWGFDLGPSEFEPKAEMVADLKGAVQASLEDQGLYTDEAIAMVETWSRQWFGSEGSRVIYLVPREVTDALLPLEIEPTPDETIRVLVGRLEYLTPEIESKTTEMLRQRIEGTTPERAAAWAWLMERDRFLEPHLRRALAQSDDPVVARSAEELLIALGPQE